MPEPLISIIVPTYNRAALICDTVRSILDQTYSNLELIVVIDGGTDDTAVRLNKIGDSRLKIVDRARAGRPAPPRNAGLRIASGNYFAFCDDDDLWMPQKLAKQIELLERNPGTGLCCCESIYFNDSATWPAYEPSTRTFKTLLYRNTIANSSVVIPRTVLEAVGLLNEDADLKAVEDWELWLRIAYRYPVVTVPEALLRYRAHSDGISADPRIMVMRSLAMLRSVRRTLSLRPGLIDIVILEFELKRLLYAFHWGLTLRKLVRHLKLTVQNVRK